MFLILVSSFVLLGGIFWHCGNSGIKVVLNWLLPCVLSLAFISFYFNGEDWVNYYFPLHENSVDPYSIYEPLFVASFLALQYGFNANFGYAVFAFYLLIFLSYVVAMKKFTLNPFFFFVFLILTIGNTFILEQIRQLMAGLFVVWSFFWLVKGRLWWASVFMLTAVMSHFASLVMVLVFGLILLPTKRQFSIATVALGCVFIVLIFYIDKILPYFDWMGFTFDKVSSYADALENGFALGYFAILDFLFILYYFFSKETDDKLKNNLLKIAFTGAVFQFSFNFFPVMLRFVSFHYIFIAMLLALGVSKISISKGYLPRIAPFGLSLIFIIFAFSSYYRNTLHPVGFFNLDISGSDIFFGDFDIDFIAHEKLAKFQVEN